MKKLAITCALLSGFVVSQVWADAASDLKSRLDKVSSFHASFTQKVTDGSGNAVQDGQGDLWVKRPNLFNWHMTQLAERRYQQHAVYADCPQPVQRLAAVQHQAERR